MKSFIVAVCLIGCAYAASNEANAAIVRSNSDSTPEGNFQYAYETENGISGQVQGRVKAVGKEVAVEISGNNEYTVDGQLFKLQYVADENGYRAEGAHLPTPPAPQPIPEYIARSLEYIAAHPYVEKKL